MLAEIRRHAGVPKRFKISVAEQVAETLVARLKAMPGVGEVTTAGSYRRRMETVGDLDILVACARERGGDGPLHRFEDVRKVLARAAPDPRCVLRSGLQVDLRVVPEESYGAALHYFTGSKAHNIAIRQMGREEGTQDQRVRRVPRRGAHRRRHRGGGLRPGRPALHRAGAAGEPRRDRGGQDRARCRS